MKKAVDITLAVVLTSIIVLGVYLEVSDWIHKKADSGSSEEFDSRKADGDKFRREAYPVWGDYIRYGHLAFSELRAGKNYVTLKDPNGVWDITYYDYDRDGVVDEYSVVDWRNRAEETKDSDGKVVVLIYNISVWDKIYPQNYQNFPEGIRYAGSRLQNRINYDYEQLRSAARRKEDSCQQPSKRAWYDEYPVQVKCD